MHRTDANVLMRFNVVTANPPFSLDKWGYENAANDPFKRFWRGLPPKSVGDYAFISHMVESTYLEPSQNGRVGVVVPNGVLFRGGSEGKIRQKLVEENLLDTVIGLAPNLFYGAGIPVALLFFKRNKSDRKVLFIDASGDFEPGTNQNKLRQQDIDRIVTAYQARELVEKFTYLADFDEIKENDFNLNISRYVDTFEPEPIVDLAAVSDELRRLKDELANVEAKMAGYLEELGLNG
jgi:type I restriction enzyme M protein